MTDNNSVALSGGGMRAREVIPVKKEFSFIFKIAAVMIASVAAALAILYLLLDKDVGNSYRAAFQMLSEILNKINIYIVGAVLVQLVFSSIVVYFTALYFSHKIAGPVYRLKMLLQQYMEGENVERVNFRKTDFIPGVSVIFTGFLKHLAKRKELLAEAELLADRLEQLQGGKRQETIERLRAILIQLEG